MPLSACGFPRNAAVVCCVRRLCFLDNAVLLGPSTDGDRKPNTQHDTKSNAFEVAGGLADADSDMHHEFVTESIADSHNRPHAHCNADAIAVACHDTGSAAMHVGTTGLFQ